MQFPIVFQLTKPITFGDETIDSLTLREPVAGDLWDFEVGGKIKIGSVLEVASSISGHPPAVIKKITPADAIRLAEVVGGFFEPGQAAPAS